MNLNDIEWKGPGSLEDVCTWGVQPAKVLLELLDEKSNFDDDPHTNMLHFELKGRLESIERAVYRLMREAREAGALPA